VHIGNDAEEARAYEVSGNFFNTLGVPMAMGRAFGPEEEEGHSSVAVLSFGYWNARFNRDPKIIGRSIHIRGGAVYSRRRRGATILWRGFGNFH
jgi:hypothetical protein